MNENTKKQLEQVNTAFDILIEELTSLDNCVMKYEKDSSEDIQKNLHSIVSTMLVADKAQEYIRRRLK